MHTHPLALIEKDGPRQGRFHYVSPNTDLLGWIMERATGQRYADLVSDLLWKPMGAGRSAYITVDRFGAPRCAGGFCATARDLARLGLLIADGGRYAGKQIIPSWWFDDIVERGDAAGWNDGDFVKYFPKMSIHYRSKWYVLRSPCAADVRGRCVRSECFHRSEKSPCHRKVLVSGLADGQAANPVHNPGYRGNPQPALGRRHCLMLCR
jgi:Beta-lactamase